MNVYDFDNTIYEGNSTVDFCKYCMRKYPKMLLSLPKIIFLCTACLVGLYHREKFVNKLFKYLKYIPDIDQYVQSFWDSHHHKVVRWYLDSQQDNDVIISASPYFLLEPICKRLSVKHLIATDIDNVAGTPVKHCYGMEKVVQFRKHFGEATIDKFFSDSRSDQPLADIAKQSFYINSKRKVLPW